MYSEKIINKDIGSRITIFRKSNHITKTKLAHILGITQQQLDKYEKGINRISAAKLEIISRNFETDILYFYNNLIIDDKTKNKQNDKENIDLLLSYYLNIKKQENKSLIMALIKEFSEN